jgi:hypothetical protein
MWSEVAPASGGGEVAAARPRLLEFQRDEARLRATSGSVGLVVS